VNRTDAIAPTADAADRAGTTAATDARPTSAREAATRARDLAIGSTFRGLHVHSRLGAGGMGVTYLASHPILQMPLVVKIIHAQRGDGTLGAQEQVFREAHFAARVTSAHVVPALDAGFEAGLPFVIQRYVDGIDLGELVQRHARMGRPVPLPAVVRLVADIARGLHAIHQAGVVHQDVKPANLFLAGGGEAAVGDFGIAREVVERTDDRLSGTPAFIAPEVWQGMRVGRRADIYALGATAHLLATGRTPFPAGTIEEARRHHLETPYAPPGGQDPRGAYFFAVVERMLRKTPEDRYPNADAVARALGVIAERMPFPDRSGLHVMRFAGVTVRLIVGDLAACESADVVVCSANPELRMRQGVAEALRCAAGDTVEAEAMAQGPVAMGEVVWTSAGRLSARAMAHAVSASEGAVCLQRCMLRLLLEAETRGMRSIAMPLIGAGVGRVPVDLAGKLVVEAIRTFASLRPQAVNEIRVFALDEAVRDRLWSILEAV
jgi:O-acetyl-ADP-ribose deacetylase (regulator of RNase III)